MDTLRKRVPFKLAESDEQDNHVLDEQEQEELIRTLQETNVVSNSRFLMFLRVILVLSFLLQLIFLSNSSRKNPILDLFPTNNKDPTPSIPLPAIATILSLAVHVNLAFLAFPGDVRMILQLGDTGIRPVSYHLLYIISAVAPTLSLFLRRSWQSTAWWSLTTAVVFIVHTVTTGINQGNESITELEGMRYTAAGA